MKKLILILLIGYCGFAQTLTYTPSSENFGNPDRGFYYHTSTESSAYDPLTASELTQLPPQGITLILRVFYLESFKTAPISQTYLNNMQTDFNRLRSAGVKAIVRFAYSGSGVNSNYDATRIQTLAHIQQLKPIMLANRDVIALFQEGFIGKYGEGWNSTYYGNAGVITSQNIIDRNAILQSLVTDFALPTGRFIQTRTPAIKQYLTGATAIQPAEAYNESAKSYIGQHNDSFLSSNTEQGTYTSSGVIAEKLYVETESAYTPTGGESNTYPTSFTNCPNALFDMNRFSYTYFNSVGYASGLIQYWTENGCLAQMALKLGYRLELISTTVNQSALTIKLRNVGFGHLYNQRNVFVVYRNEVTGAQVSVPANTDCRKWFKNTVVTLNETIPTLPSGTYQVFLNMPDSQLPTDKKFSVRFANTNTWNATFGYNDLLLRIGGSTLSVETTSISKYVTCQNGILSINIQFSQYQLFNMLGQKVKSGTESVSDLTALPDGIYLLKVDDYKAIKIIKR